MLETGKHGLHGLLWLLTSTEPALTLRKAVPWRSGTCLPLGWLLAVSLSLHSDSVPDLPGTEFAPPDVGKADSRWTRSKEDWCSNFWQKGNAHPAGFITAGTQQAPLRPCILILLTLDWGTDSVGLKCTFKVIFTSKYYPQLLTRVSTTTELTLPYHRHDSEGQEAAFGRCKGCPEPLWRLSIQ